MLAFESLFTNYKGQCYQLREMQLDDIAGLRQIEQLAHAHPWTAQNFQSSIESSHHCWLLQHTEQDDIAAYIISSTAADEAELLNITVAPAYRRLGLATALIDCLCGFLDQSIHTLFLEVREGNHSAIALYETLDFHALGKRPNYYPPANKHASREDAVIMAKTLQV